MTMPKPWYESTTLWFNLAALVVAVADQVSPFIPEKWQGTFLSIVAVANFINRLRTKTPIKGVKPAGE